MPVSKVNFDIVSVIPLMKHPLLRQIFPHWVRTWSANSTNNCLYPIQNRHMGVTAVDSKRGDIDKIITSLRESFAEVKASRL
jgi:hypothetical protein